MGEVISLLILIFVIIWATRVENGLNKLNETVARIEKHLEEFKKEKGKK